MRARPWLTAGAAALLLTACASTGADPEPSRPAGAPGVRDDRGLGPPAPDHPGSARGPAAHGGAVRDAPDARGIHPKAPAAPGTDDYRCFLLDPGLTAKSVVTGINVLPGNPDVVHHVILFRVPPDKVEGGRGEGPAPDRAGLDLLRRHRCREPGRRAQRRAVAGCVGARRRRAGAGPRSRYAGRGRRADHHAGPLQPPRGEVARPERRQAAGGRRRRRSQDPADGAAPGAGRGAVPAGQDRAAVRPDRRDGRRAEAVRRGRWSHRRRPAPAVPRQRGRPDPDVHPPGGPGVDHPGGGGTHAPARHEDLDHRQQGQGRRAHHPRHPDLGLRRPGQPARAAGRSRSRPATPSRCRAPTTRAFATSCRRFEGQPERYVVWGEGTTDEMCLGIVDGHPPIACAVRP